MLPRVKVFTKTVAIETFAVAATVYRGTGVYGGWVGWMRSDVYVKADTTTERFSCDVLCQVDECSVDGWRS